MMRLETSLMLRMSCARLLTRKPKKLLNSIYLQTPCARHLAQAIIALVMLPIAMFVDSLVCRVKCTNRTVQHAGQDMFTDAIHAMFNTQAIATNVAVRALNAIQRLRHAPPAMPDTINRGAEETRRGLARDAQTLFQPWHPLS